MIIIIIMLLISESKEGSGSWCDIIITMLLISESTEGTGSWCDIIIIMLLIPESTAGPESWPLGVCPAAPDGLRKGTQVYWASAAPETAPGLYTPCL